MIAASVSHCPVSSLASSRVFGVFCRFRMGLGWVGAGHDRCADLRLNGHPFGGQGRKLAVLFLGSRLEAQQRVLIFSDDLALFLTCSFL